MSNMLSTIIPKSDQLNADSLIGEKAMTIKITRVEIVNGEQPVALHYENDDGKPFKPCKSMRRVIIQCWGGDGNQYVGRSMTLYRDPTVKFGGMEVGGIRISHMSHIDKPVTMALTSTRANKKPFTVKPLLAVEEKPTLDDYIHDIATVPTTQGLEAKFKEVYKAYADAESREKLTLAKDKRKEELTKV